jgi:chemotaxis protein CheD
VKPTSLAGERRKSSAGDRALADNAVRRYHDPHFDVIAVKVLPGEHYVTQTAEETIVTILGSCVAACIRDPIARVGGMNHFMLPENQTGAWGGVSSSLRYGNFAMERLINDILKRGGRRSRLEIKVFGGANVLGIGATVGQQNCEFIEAYLAAEGLPIAARHLYGEHPRRVHYFPQTGKVFVLELRRQKDREGVGVEQTYRETLRQEPVAGSIELFE